MATIHPAPNFSTAQEAHRLRGEMKGFGTDEQAILKILLSMSNEQRVATVKFFQGEMDRDLVEDLTCELGSNYEDLSVALLYSPIEYTVRQLNERLEGLVDFEDNDLIELICTRNADELKHIAQRYKIMYHHKLTEHLKGDGSNKIRCLLAKMVTDVTEFHQSPLESVENDPFKSAIVECLTNPVAFFAMRLKKAFVSSGPTREKTIIRIIVTRCEIDLADIAAEFERISGRKLLKAVETDITGDYKNALCTLIGNA